MSKPMLAGPLGRAEASRKLQTVLEQLTRDTPSGDTCRVGGAFITVWYCPNAWEWEYAGETFWDLQDLAEALLQGSPATMGATQLELKGIKARRGSSRTNDTTRVPLLGQARMTGSLGNHKGRGGVKPMGLSSTGGSLHRPESG